jgi:hypothetical protein
MCPSTLLLIVVLGALFLVYISVHREGYVTQHILGNQMILKKHRYDDGMWTGYPNTL